jgi:hypothetical protein
MTYGTLAIDTLNTSTGVLASQNGITGIAKAWVNWNSGSGTVVINGSYNISSVVRNSAGNWTVNYTTAMPNANYSAQFQNNNGARFTWFDTFTSSSINCYCYQTSGPYTDTNQNCLAIFST